MYRFLERVLHSLPCSNVPLYEPLIVKMPLQMDEIDCKLPVFPLLKMRGPFFFNYDIMVTWFYITVISMAVQTVSHGKYSLFLIIYMMIALDIINYICIRYILHRKIYVSDCLWVWGTKLCFTIKIILFICNGGISSPYSIKSNVPFFHIVDHSEFFDFSESIQIDS